MTTPSSVLVSIADSSELKLVNIIGETLDDPTFITTCVTLIGEGDAPALIGQFLLPQILPSILQLPPTGTTLDDIFGIYSILLTIVKKCDDVNVEGQLVNALVNLLIDTPIPTPKNVSGEAPKTMNPHAQARLRVLVTIYNLQGSTNEKLSLLFGILSFVEKTQQLAAVTSLFQIIPQLVEEWGLNNELRRQVFIAACSSLKNGKSGDDSNDFAVALSIEYQDYWLETFEGSTQSKFDKEEMEIATSAITSRLQSPSTLFQTGSTLLNYTAIKMIESENPKLINLLKLFVNGTVGEFEKTDTKYVQSIGLNYDGALEHMRLLSLITICSSKNEISYTEIATLLNVPVAEVEGWVIKCCTLNLLTARLDQLSSLVLVTKCVSNQFNKEDWITLKEKLASWGGNIAGVVENINRVEEKKQFRKY